MNRDFLFLIDAFKLLPTASVALFYRVSNGEGLLDVLLSIGYPVAGEEDMCLVSLTNREKLIAAFSKEDSVYGFRKVKVYTASKGVFLSEDRMEVAYFSNMLAIPRTFIDTYSLKEWKDMWIYESD